jgi:hypothetical protein
LSIDEPWPGLPRRSCLAHRHPPRRFATAIWPSSPLSLLCNSLSAKCKNALGARRDRRAPEHCVPQERNIMNLFARFSNVIARTTVLSGALAGALLASPAANGAVIGRKP